MPPSDGAVSALGFAATRPLQSSSPLNWGCKHQRPPSLTAQRLDGAQPLILRSASRHCAEVWVELPVLFLQEGACPAVWVDMGPVDALQWVCSSDAKSVTHHLPGLDRIFVDEWAMWDCTGP